MKRLALLLVVAFVQLGCATAGTTTNAPAAAPAPKVSVFAAGDGYLAKPAPSKAVGDFATGSIAANGTVTLNGVWIGSIRQVPTPTLAQLLQIVAASNAAAKAK